MRLCGKSAGAIVLNIEKVSINDVASVLLRITIDSQLNFDEHVAELGQQKANNKILSSPEYQNI